MDELIQKPLTMEQVWMIADPPVTYKTIDQIGLPSSKVDLKARLAIELNRKILLSKGPEKEALRKKMKDLMKDKLSIEEERAELARMQKEDADTLGNAYNSYDARKKFDESARVYINSMSAVLNNRIRPGRRPMVEKRLESLAEAAKEEKKLREIELNRII